MDRFLCVIHMRTKCRAAWNSPHVNTENVHIFAYTKQYMNKWEPEPPESLFQSNEKHLIGECQCLVP